MCGISGLYSLNGRSIRFDVLRKMSQLLLHRGPDGEGYFLSDTRLKKFDVHYNSADSFNVNGLKPDLGLAHRRLSIIDLSVIARQPMSNDDGSLWIVFNGEIYNYIELRR
ncbi:MAG TPA: asparagine synthetase B, partial [Candidatus Omnitrophica bacterium]|nr:asparagine synthetase B [Candidatus Omnitrophota bacterium]